MELVDVHVETEFIALAGMRPVWQRLSMPAVDLEAYRHWSAGMPVMSDRDLYDRGVATLLASWEAYARGAQEAAVRRLPGAAAAVFPTEPERGVYNNALLDRDLTAIERAEALDGVEAAYAAADVSRFAVWVHESDDGTRLALERRDYTFDTSTRAMGMALDDLSLPRPEVDVGAADWAEYLRVFGLPAGLLRNADHSEFHLLIGRLDGEVVTTAMSFDFDGDCGIYNVGTLERARRRGLASAITAAQLHDARDRGCRTATLQATPMAERVYAAAGLRDLGRYLEYVP